MLNHTSSPIYKIVFLKKKFFFEEKWQASKVVQRVKTYAASSASLNLMTATHVVGED